MLKSTTQNVRRMEWDETVEAQVCSAPMTTTSALIECICGERLGNQEYCSSSGCPGMVKSFVGTDFTRQIAGDIAGNARTLTWFHSTLDANWEETIKKEDVPPVHVGVKAAAEQLGKMKYNGGFFLYEVRLKDNTTVAPYLCPDNECNWSETTDVFYDKVGADFIGYINLYEAAGNLSLIGFGTQLEVVKQTWVSTMEKDEELLYVENILEEKRRFGRPDMEIAHEMTQLEGLLEFLSRTPSLV